MCLFVDRRFKNTLGTHNGEIRDLGTKFIFSAIHFLLNLGTCTRY